MASFVVWGLMKPAPPETETERRARIEERLAIEQRAASANQRTRALCERQALCRKFGDARQACATAGNLKTCIDIKMGDHAIDLYPCMNNGTVWDTPKDMPDRLTCLTSSAFHLNRQGGRDTDHSAPRTGPQRSKVSLVGLLARSLARRLVRCRSDF